MAGRGVGAGEREEGDEHGGARRGGVGVRRKAEAAGGGGGFDACGPHVALARARAGAGEADWAGGGAAAQEGGWEGRPG